MTAWTELTAAMIVFVASHFLPSRPAVKNLTIGYSSRNGYGIVYSLISVVVLGWMIMAARRAPYIELWSQAVWMRWAPNLAMPIAISLASAGIGTGWR